LAVLDRNSVIDRLAFLYRPYGAQAVNVGDFFVALLSLGLTPPGYELSPLRVLGREHK
jgi:hypothetical protein